MFDGDKFGIAFLDGADDRSAGDRFDFGAGGQAGEQFGFGVGSGFFDRSIKIDLGHHDRQSVVFLGKGVGRERGLVLAGVHDHHASVYEIDGTDISAIGTDNFHTHLGFDSRSGILSQSRGCSKQRSAGQQG